jgi:uncharacterized alpha-E superfamily protein
MKHNTLSRTAQRTYWFARYLERAESTARLVNVNANMLIDLPVHIPLGWQPLLDIMSARDLFNELYDEANERNVVRFLTTDLRNPGSIMRSLEFARENARTIREIMPRVTFEYINQLFLFARHELGAVGARSRRAQIMDGIVAHVEQFAGFLDGAMLRDHNWNFFNLGKYLERGDMTTRIIEVRATSPFELDGGLEPFGQWQWRSILRSLHAMQNYRIFMQEPVSQPLSLEFLFRNPDLPRSFAYCMECLRAQLRRLPRNEKPLRASNRIIRTLAKADVSTLDGPTLLEFINECQVSVAHLHDLISATYFHGRVRRAPQKKRKRAPESIAN